MRSSHTVATMAGSDCLDPVEHRTPVGVGPVATGDCDRVADWCPALRRSCHRTAAASSSAACRRSRRERCAVISAAAAWACSTITLSCGESPAWTRRSNITLAISSSSPIRSRAPTELAFVLHRGVLESIKHVVNRRNMTADRAGRAGDLFVLPVDLLDQIDDAARSCLRYQPIEALALVLASPPVSICSITWLAP